ncbi:MAG: PIN domain-containing protein [Candidatus Altiarchaeales archaeon]|nr:PIN domain-containing protein [Candidatus Altiarchaeales archaeon]
MNIVIDSNILFSALIKDSTTRKIILEYEGYFFFPYYIFEELEKHKDEIQKKSGLSKDDFNQLLELLLEKVHVIPNEVLDRHKDESIERVKEIDLNDAVFIACALAFPNTILWTDDKKLKQITEIQITNTQEIIKIIKK